MVNHISKDYLYDIFECILEEIIFLEAVCRKKHFFLNSIDRDGTAEGYDLDLIKSVSDSVKVPLIACGGVGSFEHFVDGIKKGNASAVAAGNIFNYTENSVIRAKKTLQNAGIEIRKIVKLGY